MASRWHPFVLGVVFAVAMVTASSPTSSKSSVHPKTDLKREIADSSSSDEKDKRSQEEIMFGNQQNKPAGMVDDILSFPDRKSDTKGDEVNDNDAAENDLDKNSTHEDAGSGTKFASSEEPNQARGDEANDTTASVRGGRSSEVDTVTGKEEGLDYYDYLGDLDESRSFETLPGSKNPSTAQRNSPPPLFLYDLNDAELGDYSNYDYNGNAAGAYRRKRAARRAFMKRRRAAFSRQMKKRSLHSNLDDLLRSRRLHRRALRLKRDAASVQDLLAWLSTLPRETEGNSDKKYPDITTPSEGKLTISSHLPSPDAPALIDIQDADEYSSPYSENGFRADNFYIPSSDSAFMEEDLVLPPEYASYYNPREASEPEEIPQWAWMSGPSNKEINLARRTAPFYPQDYRFITLPGQKKRSSSFRSREHGAMNFGPRWGKIVERRSEPSYNWVQPEGEDEGDDMERLYALASLLAEAEESPDYRSYRKRRSAK